MAIGYTSRKNQGPKTELVYLWLSDLNVMITSRFFRPIAICKTAETIGPTCLSSCSHVSDTSGSLCSTGHNCPPAATWLSSVCQVVGWEMLNPLWVWSIRNALLGWKKTATCSSTAIWGAVKSPSCSWSCSLPSISNKRTSWYSQVESFEVCPCYCFLQAKKNKILTSVARYKASHHSRRVFRQHQR